MGDRDEGFAALFERAYSPVWTYVRRRVPPDDVDDVVAEVFTVAWRRLEDIPEQSAVAWLFGVARRTIGNQIRSQRRRLRLVNRLASAPVPVSVGDPAEPHAVLEALSALRAQDQEILRLAAWEDLGPREIAVVLGCSVNAATLRLSRARKRFREQLTGSGVVRTHTDRKEIDV